MQDLQNKVKKELESIVHRLTAEVALLHSGRATPALVEHVQVQAYGGKMPLREIASLSAPDAKTILVQPWDVSLLGDIQKALETAHRGLGMVVQETHVRLTLPMLSEERRKEILKLLGKKTEEARIAVRRVRDQAGKTLEETERNKEISEDQKFRAKETLQKIIDEYNTRIADIEQKKNADISS